MSNKKEYKTLVKIWFIIIMIIPIVGLFNYIIDPYRINCHFNLNNINIYKKSNDGYTFRFKTNIIRKGNFTSLMLGSSRIGVMNPDIVDKYINGKTFNFEAPGSIPIQHYKLMMYALKYNNIKYIIYGIDFFSFNGNRTIKNDLKNFNQFNNEITNKKKITNYDLYFNLSTFQDSLYIIKENILGNKIINMHYLCKNGMRDFEDRIDSLKNNKFDIDKFIKQSIHNYFRPNGVYKKYKFSYEYLKYFKRIVRYCKNNNIKLFVYIPPMYVEHFNKIYQTGYTKEFEVFKQEIVKITDYIDFTGNNIISNNKNNYWDSSHLRKEITPIIMDRIFNKSIEKQDNRVGILVTKKNITQHLKNIRP